MPLVPMWMPVLGHLQRSWGFAHLWQSHLLFAPLGHEHTTILPIFAGLFFFHLFKLATNFITTFLSVSGNNPPRDSAEDSALICISSLLNLELLSAGAAWDKRQHCHPEILEQQMCLSGNTKILILSPRMLWQRISISGLRIWQQSNVFFTWSIFLNLFPKKKNFLCNAVSTFTSGLLLPQSIFSLWHQWDPTNKKNPLRGHKPFLVSVLILQK